MQIAVCVYNVETRHLIRLDLIHLSPLCCKHLRGYWIQSHQNAFDLYSTDCDYFSYKLCLRERIYFSSLSNGAFSYLDPFERVSRMP